MTLLGLQSVLDGFKQCHLKARYVTEKQIGEGRGGEKGEIGEMKNTPWRDQGPDVLQGQGAASLKWKGNTEGQPCSVS